MSTPRAEPNPRGLRIVSLLPSATEIVCALGAQNALVGISHECDFPAGLAHVPALTRARIGALDSSRAIDSAVRDALRDALSIYEVDAEKLRAARPNLIVTQDLCEVCAVSLDDVRAAVARLAATDVDVVSLSPTRLDEIWQDIERVAGAVGRAEVGRSVVSELRARVSAISRRAETAPERPGVLTIEWIDPIMIGGMWMPELVELAGGTPLVTKPGDHAPTLSRDALAALDPDVVVVKPCGFPLERTLNERSVLPDVLPWSSWRAVREERVFLTDGNAFFNRPGPRIVESLEILAACIHPDIFPDWISKHRRSVARVGADLAVR